MATSHAPGSYSLGESRLFSRVGKERSVTSGAKVQRVEPKARIVRPINLKASRGEIEPWNDYLIDIGSKNEGKGTAKSLGSVAMTFVKDTEMGRMIMKKSPELFENKFGYPNLLAYLRHLREDYARFSESKSQEVVAKQQLAAIGRYDGIDAWQEAHTKHSQWYYGDFEVQAGLQNLGQKNQSLVFDETSNHVLEEEMHQTWEFLGTHVGLDISLIDQNRRPHLTVYEATYPIALVALRTTVHPCAIGLAPPHIRVNSNSPSHPN
jgi:hypothetical protein